MSIFSEDMYTQHANVLYKELWYPVCYLILAMAL